MFVFHVLSLAVADIRKEEVARDKGDNNKGKKNHLHIFSSVDLITSLTLT